MTTVQVDYGAGLLRLQNITFVDAHFELNRTPGALVQYAYAYRKNELLFVHPELTS